VYFLTNFTKSGLPQGSSRIFPAAAVGGARRFAVCLGLACTLAAVGFAPLAWAADDQAPALSQSPIVVSLKQFKVTIDAKGTSKLGDASVVLPGDVIEYQATYSNRGASALAVTATVPVPEAVEYQKDSAKSKPSLPHVVALKDSLFAQEPLVKKVTMAGGATLAQPVPYADYRFVRWDLGRLLPNTSVEVSIRAKVAQSPEGEATPGK
jgi:uncharacterized repeat protein (TIGR01451 family)